MYWPDTQTGVDVEPARKPVASAVRKFFTEGGLGQAPTVPGGDWFNQITNELLNVLAAAGIDPSKTDDDQLLQAINGISKAMSAREALRRSYAEAGYKLVDGSFEEGGTVATSSDVLLYEASGKAYSWGGDLPKTVDEDSTPTSSGGIAVGAWESKANELSTASYTIKNRRLLGVANNLLRSDGALKIVCVGDSITYGYDETSSDGLAPIPPHIRKRAPIQYPSRLQDRLTQLTDCAVTVTNYGYSGDTAKQGYARWTTNPECHVAHIMFGINDAAGALGATFAEYCEYMEKLIRRYIDWGHGVVIHTASAQQYNNGDTGGTRYTQYARSIAEAYGCPVFESEGVHQYCRYAAVYSDSTHFNKAGYAKYGDAVAAFILAGSWVRPVRTISANTMQQAGRATEGIGWFGKGGAYVTFNETGSYMWNGQTGGLLASQSGVSSFSFYLDAEAANIFGIGLLNGAKVCLSEPVTTVDGNEAVNQTPQKSASKGIVETKSYTVSVRPQGYKQWLGALVGRGWKTVYIEQPASNARTAFLNELMIEPCNPDETVQTNSSVMPATKEVMVFNHPVQPISDSALPPVQKMPLKVYFPLPKGLYRQSQIWTNYFDNLVVDISIVTRTSDGGATYNGIHKITAYTDSSNGLVLASIFKSQANNIAPTTIKYGWEAPNNPGTITESAYPPGANPASLMYLIFTFPDTPAAYHTMEVECSSILNGMGTYMY